MTMNQVYKQMIVMLLSVAFMASVAVIVLSSSAAASDGYFSNDAWLVRQMEPKPHIGSDAQLSTERTPAPQQSYFRDDPIVYHNDKYEIERIEDELETMRYETTFKDGYDTDFSDRITDGIYALLIILIIGFIGYCILYNVVEYTDKMAQKPRHHIPETDATESRIKLTPEEMEELDVFLYSDAYTQADNKDMALNYKVNQIVENRSTEDIRK